MNIQLGKHFEEMIQKRVASGQYANASEVVREALRRMEVNDQKLERLRAKIAEADASFERGEGIEITDLKAFFEDLKQRAIERANARNADKVHAGS